MSCKTDRNNLVPRLVVFFTLHPEYLSTHIHSSDATEMWLAIFCHIFDRTPQNGPVHPVQYATGSTDPSWDTLLTTWSGLKAAQQAQQIALELHTQSSRVVKAVS